MADLVIIGGGQDREQETVARELTRLGDQLIDLVAGGTALLAVCGGYQNLGIAYRTSRGTELPCPGLLPVSTDGFGSEPRLVGSILAQMAIDLPLSDTDPAHDRTIVGFENHGGRTFLAAGAQSLATVEIGHGNNGIDGTEGVLVLPDEGGLSGLRIGTYLHGPLLPRNPHIADALLACALARGQGPVELAPLDDRLEWAAHDQARDRMRRTAREDRRVPGWAHRALDPIRALVGY